ncbi:hypothetical protein R5R35_003321 [Gryllus longicercus]|uniref:Transmembrane protein 59 n=1 Tax=Gryllus longicercus TaxID=2509291 RepID=A0AAN9Z443_9ORTH
MERRYYGLLGLFLTFLIRQAESDLFYDLFSKDPCESFCDKTYPSNTLDNVEHSSCCCRGCRFFNLVHLVEDRDNVDLNVTKDACQASCMEAYVHTKDRYACNIGCSQMAKQKQAELHVTSISWSMYVEDGNSVFMLQPDPGLRRQLEHSWGFDGELSGDDDGRIPETHVRTLPMDNMVGRGSGGESNPSIVSLHSRMSGDWLDCAARKIGLPRMVLAGVVLFAVLMALWLCLAPDRRSNSSNIEYMQPLDMDETKDLLEPPPKYSLHVDRI